MAGLDAETLAYEPGPETNSVGVLVRHTLGSEALVLATLAGRSVDTDAARDFSSAPTSDRDLLQQLDEADRLLDELCPLISREALDRTWPRPPNRLVAGREWLAQYYGHAREHLGHAELTLQLYRAGLLKTAPVGS